MSNEDLLGLSSDEAEDGRFLANEFESSFLPKPESDFLNPSDLPELGLLLLKSEGPLLSLKGLFPLGLSSEEPENGRFFENDFESSFFLKSEPDFLNPSDPSGLLRLGLLPLSPDGPLLSNDLRPLFDLDEPLRLREEPDESDLGIWLF